MSEYLTTDPILQIQADLRTAILADPWFTGIPVVCSEPGNLEAQINTALGKLGLVITIQPLKGKLQGSTHLDMDIGITVTEKPLLNRSASGLRKTATQVVINLLRVFSSMSAQMMVLDDWDLVNDNDGLLIYLTRGKCAATLSFT